MLADNPKIIAQAMLASDTRLALATPEGRVDHDTLADLNRCDILTYLSHHTCHVRAANMRQLEL
jgi:hypothetical protein